MQVSSDYVKRNAPNMLILRLINGSLIKKK